MTMIKDDDDDKSIYEMDRARFENEGPTLEKNKKVMVVALHEFLSCCRLNDELSAVSCCEDAKE